MLNKILLADGVTELLNVKSVVFREAVNADSDLRPGCVSSASIEVEVYNTQANAVAEGDALYYYQIDKDDNETLIGKFYAQPVISGRNSYRFTAYDDALKLDADFSAWLEANKANFPMTVYSLVSAACTVAGVTLSSASWPLSTENVQAFYADGIKCRDILAYAAEIACRFVRCNTSGEIVFDWYGLPQTGASLYDASTNTNGKYINANGGIVNGTGYCYTALIPVNSGMRYVFSGVNYGTSNYNKRVHGYDSDGVWVQQLANKNVAGGGSFAINVLIPDGIAYVRLSLRVADTDVAFSPYYAIGPSVDAGRVAYKQGGLSYANYDTAAVARVAVYPSGEDSAAYLYPTNVQSGNTLEVKNNLLLTGAASALYNAVAQNVYTEMTALGNYRPFSASLFPKENPFRAGNMVCVTDAQGVVFESPVMYQTVTSGAASLSAGGNKSYTPKTEVQKAVTQLASDIVQINKLKVDWADIGTAIVNELQANGINADWINTGRLTVKSPYSNTPALDADVSSRIVKLGPIYVSEAGMFFGNITQPGTYLSLTYYGLGLCQYAIQYIDGHPYPTYLVRPTLRFQISQPFPDVSANDGVTFKNENFAEVFGDANVYGTLAVKGNLVLTDGSTYWRNIGKEIGDLSQLNTTNKTDLVSAINEVLSRI